VLFAVSSPAPAVHALRSEAREKKPPHTREHRLGVNGQVGGAEQVQRQQVQPSAPERFGLSFGLTAPAPRSSQVPQDTLDRIRPARLSIAVRTKNLNRSGWNAIAKSPIDADSPLSPILSPMSISPHARIDFKPPTLSRSLVGGRGSRRSSLDTGARGSRRTSLDVGGRGSRRSSLEARSSPGPSRQ